MDKNTITRAQVTLRSIRKQLLLNERVRSLLYYESEDFKEGQEVPDIQLVENNIFLQPVVSNDLEPPFNKKIYIALALKALVPLAENAVDYTIQVSVMAHKTDWVLEKNRIRVLELVQEVINTIDGVKFAGSHPMDFEQLIQTVIDTNVQGYSILFAAIDGTGEVQGE